MTAFAFSYGCLVGDIEKPNVIYILADDLGYGDIKSFNKNCAFPTPGVDRMAREGVRFTDAHSGSSVCTPTRYGILTGRYAWRTRLQKGVLRSGVEPLIDRQIMTVQKFFKRQGYATACFGKWHLGFKYILPEGKKIEKQKGGMRAVPVGTKVLQGPITRDFDVFQGYHHSGEMNTWIDQDEVTENFRLVDMLPRIMERSLQYLDQRGREKGKPFFMYVPLNSPHGPIVPSRAWQGKSGVSAYADYVMQTDDVVAQILNKLDELKLADQTMVIFTADNGTAPIANFKDLRAKGHDPVGGLRGHKSDIWEGGHRVPFVVRWPGRVKADRVVEDSICHNGLLATCAEMLGVKLKDDEGVDSFSILPHLLGVKQGDKTHPLIVHHSGYGKFSIRKGKWKFIAGKGSGGWSRGDDGQPVQVYDLESDLQEKKNLFPLKRMLATSLVQELEDLIDRGRSRPGKLLENDVSVDLWKTKRGEPVELH